MIKAGYNLYIYSWENDLDNRNTIHYHTENKNEVRFILEFLELFRSQHDGRPGRKPGYGNRCDMSEADYQEVLEKANKLSEKYDLKPFEDRYHLGDFTYDLLGGSEWYVYRVFDTVTVYYMDKDIHPITTFEEN
tara:strand:- start:5206 stop:5607 length:402 start_codon:yes stop_codon:yes gene_type:complete